MDKLKVHRNTLLLMAGIVWSIAGTTCSASGCRVSGYVTFLNHTLIGGGLRGVSDICIRKKVLSSREEIMQAIMETAFDIVYLTSVITIGILMIRRSRGRRQYRLFRIWR